MRYAIALLIALFATPILAQEPDAQLFRWVPGQEIALTVNRSTGATLEFAEGETIERVSTDDPDTIVVAVAPDQGQMKVTPVSMDRGVRVDVFTDRRFYRFRVTGGSGPAAIRTARLDGTGLASPPPLPEAEVEPVAERSYSISGDREVRPESVRDDGTRTFITYREEQALPAVFAIGPTGEEEVVNGHMRGEKFVIDRVYQELVFRIDRKRARAERNKAEEVDR